VKRRNINKDHDKKKYKRVEARLKKDEIKKETRMF